MLKKISIFEKKITKKVHFMNKKSCFIFIQKSNLQQLFE